MPDTQHHEIMTRKQWRKQPGLFDFDSPDSPASIARDTECWLLVAGDGTDKNKGIVDLCYKFARQLAKSNPDVEDLVQDSLIHAYNAAKRFMAQRGTKYITFAHSWVKHAVKNCWDKHHRRGLKGKIENDDVPTLFTASDPDGGDDLFSRVSGDEEDQLELISAASWWEQLPAEPTWIRETARLKWGEGLPDKEVRRKTRCLKKDAYAERIRHLTQLIAEMLDVDQRGRRPEDECGKYHSEPSERWWKRWATIPEEREDLRDVGYAFYRAGQSVREIAEEWHATSADIIDMIREIDGGWKEAKKTGKSRHGGQGDCQETGVRSGDERESAVSEDVYRQY
jgi:RNA polymerase sigma factor (sigma-70 family)